MESTLLFAAENGDIASLRRALAAKPPINIDCKGKLNQTNGYSALMLGAKAGNLQIVKILVEKGADTEIKNKNGFTALMLAASNNNLACMMVLLLGGANIEARCNYGITSLMYAATSNRIEALKLLLDFGASTEAINDGGSTALMKAAEKGNIEALDVLLSRGADLDTANFQGNSAIMCAARQTKKDCFLCLVRHGADVNLTNKNMVSVASAYMKENPEVAENARNIWDSTPLHMSIYLNDKLYLFSQNVRGQRITDIDSYGRDIERDLGTENDACKGDAWTPLHVAAHLGRVEYTEFLIRKGANISLLTTKSKLTALHLASARGHLKIMGMLLAAMMKCSKDLITGEPDVNENVNANDLSLDSLEIDPGLDSP